MFSFDFRDVCYAFAERLIGFNRLQMPSITPHVCRHTYCSNMTTGMNPKTLQYLMGHSDISITMNTYTHIKFEDARDEVVRVCSEQLAAKNHIQRVRVQAIG
ncbi:MAG: tyrosine-type recombinase/integrase [Oscillospiraceae bacterium]|nr:tyrosine-type recombinase/integrase [Oscillospiraceae bacterium]